MGLFNRNKNNEEITNLKEEIINLKEEITNTKTEINNKQKQNKEEIEKELTNQESKIEHTDKLLTTLQEQQEELSIKITNLQNILSTILKKQEEVLNKTENSSKKKHSSSESHKFVFKTNPDLYGELSLRGDKIITSNGRQLGFNIQEVISLKNNLQKYYEKGYPISQLVEIHNIKKDTIKKVIYNIEEGTFDKLIEDYDSKNEIKSDNTKNHKFKMDASYKVPYKRTLNEKGELYANGKKMPYDINDILLLKKSIENPNNKSVKDVLKDFNGTHLTGCRLIWNIEEGNFDDLIKKWNEGFNEKTSKKKHYREVPKSLQNPLTGKIVLVDGGELFNETSGRTLNYTIQDILTLQENIIDFNNYPTFKSLGEDLKLSETSVKILIWRIEEGYFDDLINEYLQRNYTYENNFNRLFINGKNTGLSLDKCTSIIECIINSTHKKDVVNNLIKMYPTIESKYIRIISEEYDNPNLSKILKREVKKIPKIDNPQKRRELGVYQ